jgi:transcriptional regulator with XRE-family HTH domain
MSAKTCSKCGGQGGPRYSRGMCNNCYQMWYRRQTAYGRFEGIFIPSGPVLEHLEKLDRAGIGNGRIGDLAGISRRTVQRLRSSETCRRGTAAKILAIPVPNGPMSEERAGGARISPLGTVRRLRALTAAGYTLKILGERLGTTYQAVAAVQSGRQRYVTVRLARSVAQLFDQLQMIPGPSRSAQLRAQRLGWALPLQWDEDRIDDPKARPFKHASADWMSEYVRLRARGYTQKKVADLMGIHQSSLNKRLQRSREHQEVA